MKYNLKLIICRSKCSRSRIKLKLRPHLKFNPTSLNKVRNHLQYRAKVFLIHPRLTIKGKKRQQEEMLFKFRIKERLRMMVNLQTTFQKLRHPAKCKKLKQIIFNLKLDQTSKKTNLLIRNQKLRQLTNNLTPQKLKS